MLLSYVNFFFSYSPKLKKLNFFYFFLFCIAIYRRNCEELALLGFNTNGMYRVDIDGPGPLPPTQVYCDFSLSLDHSTTVIYHNLRNETVSVISN